MDLPPADEVSNRKDIESSVAELISAEPGLLTVKRHQAALVTLLGRLYSINVESSDPTSDPTSEGEDEAEPSADGALMQVQVGDVIVLIGLCGKQAAHNGEIGTISEVKKDKYKVSIRGEDEMIKVKGIEHLVPAKLSVPLSVGSSVAIRGLRNHVELNGCLGKVVECHEENHRFEVRATDSGQLFRVKQENLVPVNLPNSAAGGVASKENREPNTSASPRLRKDVFGGGGAASSASAGQEQSQASLATGDDEAIFEVGSIVQLVGLKTAMVYNGQSAEVLSTDRARGRYEIRLNDGSVKTIRAENVKLVERAPKSSARGRTRTKKEEGGGSVSKSKGA